MLRNVSINIRAHIEFGTPVVNTTFRGGEQEAGQKGFIRRLMN